MKEKRIKSARGFLLKKNKISNSSLIGSVFLYDYGLQNFIAKGALKNTKMYDLELFKELNFSFSGGKLLSSLYISELDTLISYNGFYNINNFLSGCYINELMIGIKGHSDDNLFYKLYKSTLIGLDKSLSKIEISKHLRLFELEVINLLGIAPNWNYNYISGSEVNRLMWYKCKVEKDGYYLSLVDNNLVSIDKDYNYKNCIFLGEDLNYLKNYKQDKSYDNLLKFKYLFNKIFVWFFNNENFITLKVAKQILN